MRPGSAWAPRRSTTSSGGVGPSGSPPPNEDTSASAPALGPTRRSPTVASHASACFLAWASTELYASPRNDMSHLQLGVLPQRRAAIAPAHCAWIVVASNCPARRRTRFGTIGVSGPNGRHCRKLVWVSCS